MNAFAADHGLAHFLVVLAVQASVLSGVALACAGACRGAALRHNLLLATVLCLLGSPVLVAAAEWGGVVFPLAWLAPRVTQSNIAALPAMTTKQADLRPSAWSTQPPAPRTLPPRRSDTASAAVRARVATPRIWTRPEWLLAGLWGGGAALGLGGILRAAWRTRQLLRDATRVDPGQHAVVIEQACARLGINHYAPIAATGKVRGPAVVSVWRQTWVLIPLRLLETLTHAELVQVLVHEGAHVLRRDPLVVLVQRIAAAIHWWNPLVLWLNRQLARAREEVCDNFVLRQERPEDYGATLLRLATLSPGLARAVSHVGLLGGRWKLEDRIRGLLDPARPSTTRIRSGTAAGIWTCLALLSTLFAVTRLVAQPPASEPPTAKPPVTREDDPAPAESTATSSEPDSAAIEQAKLDYRTGVKGAKRTEAAKLLYRLVRKGTKRGDVLTFFGAPDGFKAGLARIFNYTVDEGQELEFEFDPRTERLIRKRETGLEMDPPAEEPGPIPEALKPYLADYATAKTTFRAGFILPRAEVVWGEPLEITLRVENIGREDEEFTFGGDYRGAGRHNRIKVRVLDAEGRLLPDPRAEAPDFGGIVSREYLTPGGLAFERTFNLADYCTLDTPGVYTVKCSIALDEEHQANEAPRMPVVESQFDLIIVERTPERVGRVMDRLLTDAGTPRGLGWDEALNRVAQFGQADAIPRLAALAAEGPIEQRTAALASLPLVTKGDAEAVALSSLDDDERAIGVAAAGALGQFRTPRGEEALLAKFSMEDSVVNEAILKALGAAQSARGLKLIEQTIETGPRSLKLAGLRALVAFNRGEAISLLRGLANSEDLLFRYQVLRGLDDLRQPMEPDWLVPILMCRAMDHEGWHDVLRMIRVDCPNQAIPVLLSGLDFEVPWSSRNMWILSQVEACADHPPCNYEYDPNSEGKPDQWEKNRQTLARLKPLAREVPAGIVRPRKSRVPYLKTQPAIDFETVITPITDGVELTSGFYQLRLNRNGSTMSYTPTPEHAPAYELVQKVRLLLATPESLANSGLSREQVSQLGSLPPDYVPYDGLTTQLYSAWRESPSGPIQDQAALDLGDAVRRASQDYHAAVVAFAQRAREVLNAPPVQQQIPEAPEFGVEQIDPSQHENPDWLALRARLAESAVKFRRVVVDEHEHCRLSLAVTPTTDLSHLRGMKIHELDLSNTGVTDLSALRGMPLQVLDLSGTRVADLAPLEGISLERLSITGTQVSDLSPLTAARLKELVANGTYLSDLAPLARMPLAYLDIRRTRVRDLAALAKTPLATLQVEDCPVSDWSPLRGLPLVTLLLGGVGNEDLAQLGGISAKTLILTGKEITDLAPLKGLALESLTLEQTSVESLAPLSQMPLTSLSLRDTPVTDLTPLARMQLESLDLSEAGVDLAPLRMLPLRRISIPRVPTVLHLEVLREMSTLESIRLPESKFMAAAEFWKQLDAGAFGEPK